jgi:hypothetical protein
MESVYHIIAIRVNERFWHTFGGFVYAISERGMTPNCLKAIHSDNKIEFKNVSFEEFCLEHGIDQ